MVVFGKIVKRVRRVRLDAVGFERIGKIWVWGGMLWEKIGKCWELKLRLHKTHTK